MSENMRDNQWQQAGWIASWMARHAIDLDAAPFGELQDHLAALQSQAPEGKPEGVNGTTPAEREGWKLVPVEPTEEMIAEAISEYVGDVDALETYRAMLSAAPTAMNQSNDVPERLWQSLFWDLAKELKCLPSSFVDANEHVFNKARQLMALSGESGISYSSHKPTVFHDREATNEDLVAALIDKLKQHIPYCDESGVIGFALHDYGRILQLAEALSTPPQQQEQKHGSAGSSGEVVEVCAECDIAGCRHFRERSTPSESQAANTQEKGMEAVGYIDKLQLERWDRLRGTEYEVVERAYIGFSKLQFTTDITDCTLPVYLAPPSATAIESAAIMRAAAAVACPGRTIFDTEKAILALIPQDGRTALEKFGMKVATETRSAVLINTREDLFTEDSSLRAIVSQTIDKIGGSNGKAM